MNRIVVLAALAVASPITFARSIQPISYEMVNGETGLYKYHDDTYSGSGDPNQDLSYLFGGLGKLTDGYAATADWDVEPQSYVGWRTATPSITFNFASSEQIDSITIHIDAPANHSVLPPSRVLLEWATGSLFYDIPDPNAGGPLAMNFTDLGIEGNQVIVTMYRAEDNWLMCSEIEFNAVPTPGGVSLAGIALLGLARRRR